MKPPTLEGKGADELVSTHQRRRLDVDGMRGIAVLAVIGYHFFPGLVPAGYVGVDVFFVISGFVITNLLLRQQPMRLRGLASFWGHRIRRIFPALAVMLAATLVIGWFILWPAPYVLLGSSVTWSSAMLGNIFAWSQTGYFVSEPTSYPLLNLWSLGVEEQFYLVWPILLALLVALLRGRVLVATLVLAATSWVAAVAWTRISPDANIAASATFYLPWFRAWELLAGALVAMALFGAGRERWLRWAGAVPRWIGLVLMALLVACAVVAPPSLNPAWYALPTVLVTTALIWLGASPRHGDRSLLGTAPLLWFGRISYSLYLWHWPLLCFALAMGLAETWLSLLPVLALSILLAYLTRRFVEVPILARPVTVRGSVILLACVALVGAAGLIVTKAHGFPDRASGVARELGAFTYDPSADYREGVCFSSTDQPVRGTWPAECLTGESGKGHVLLWGDSLAASMYYGLQSALEGTASVAQVTAGACPATTQVEGRSADCQFALQTALSALADQPWDGVVIAGDWKPGSGADLARTIAYVTEATGLPASKVTIVGPPPKWTPSLPGAWPYVFAQNLAELPEYSDRGLVRSQWPVDDEISATAAAADASYVDALDEMCTDEGCLVRTGSGVDTLTAWDLYHLTRDGSIYLGERIAAALPLQP